MSKKRLISLLVLSLLVIALATVLAGCDQLSSLMGRKHDITWTIEFDKEASENAVITVMGYDKLPTKIPAGEEITVTIEGINGYKVHRVKINNRKTLPDENGNYVFTVSESTEVEITLREKVAGVKMPDLTFYAGDVLDRKAVQAEIIYETGRTEMTNKYSVIYQSEGAESFSLGDTSYTLKLSADRDNLYPVDLKQAVCCKGVIDPYGGQIAEEYVNALKTNTDIENVTVEADGSITFTFTKPLTADIPLPTPEQISKGEAGDFTFLNWSGEILSGADKSVYATAVYRSKLVTLSGVKLEMREVDGENIPCLIINGQFEAANSVYLFLRENNKDVELVGSSTTNENAERGESFELIFDLRETNHSEFFGAWMDIKLNAEIDGHTEAQDINIADYAEGFVDLTSEITFNGFKYKFQTYADLLKLETTEYFYHEYSFDYELNENGEVILTISGNIVPKYAGYSAKLDIEYDHSSGNQTVETKYCVIGENGDYSVSMNLFSIPIGCNAYIHFRVVDNEDTVIFVGRENNLLNEWCVDENLDPAYTGVGLITDGGIRCPNADESKTYYVGKGKWGGIVIYGRNDNQFSCSYDDASIYEENGRVIISVSGKYRGTKAEMEAEAALWVCDLQENPYAAGKTDWSGSWTAHNQDPVITINDDGSFALLIDVTDIGWNNPDLSKQCYTTHLGRQGEGSNGQNPDLKLSVSLNSTITVGEAKYTIISVPGSGDGNTFWGCLGLIIEK